MEYTTVIGTVLYCTSVGQYKKDRQTTVEYKLAASIYSYYLYHAQQCKKGHIDVHRNDK